MKLYSEQLGEQLEKFEQEHGDYSELLNNYIELRSKDDRHGFKNPPSHETIRADRLLRQHTELIRCMVTAKMTEKRYEQINNSSDRIEKLTKI